MPHPPAVSWKLKHRASGLFYGTARRMGQGKWTNLSPEGKTYHRKPSLRERPWYRDQTGQMCDTAQDLDIIAV